MIDNDKIQILKDQYRELDVAIDKIDDLLGLVMLTDLIGVLPVSTEDRLIAAYDTIEEIREDILRTIRNNGGEI